MKSVQRNRRLVAVTLFSLALIAVLWQPVSAWLSSRVPPPKIKLSIALNHHHPGSALVFLAQANGYFAQQGLDATFFPYTSGRDALAAALQKRTDLAISADIPVMFAALEGAPVAIVATIFTASRANGIVARRDRGIASIANLKNKTIGVTLKTDGHFVLSAMLARYQTALSDMRIEPMLPLDMQAALASGKVDAISIWEPELSAAAKTLGENAIVFRTEGRFVFDYNLVGDAGWIKAHPEQIERLLRVLLRAKQYADAHPRQAWSIIAAAMKLDAGIFDAAGPDYHFVLELNQNLLGRLEDQARWAIQNRLTNSTVMPNFLHIMYMDALIAVKPDAVTIVR